MRKSIKQRPQGGRTAMGEEVRNRYQVMMEPSLAERVRQLGGGNFSAGVNICVQREFSGRPQKDQ